MKKTNFELQSAIGFISNIYKDFSEKDLIRVPEAQGKRPDFYYAKDKTLIEIKAIYERAENDESARWSTIVNGIKREIVKNPTFNEINGLYSITTPRNITISRDKHGACANEIIKSIKENKPEAVCFGYKFEIKRFEAEKSDIVFAGFGHVRSIDPAGIINANIAEKIINANKQLAFNKFDVEKRIILLVNRVYVGSITDVIKSLALMYDSLLNLENVDEIWLQIEGKEQPYNELIYTKDFIQAFEHDSLDPQSKNHISLFEKWYWALEELPNKKNNILNALHKFLNSNIPSKIFMDNGRRESMVRFGDYLLKQDDISNAKWLIQKFINDPDPGNPNNYKGKPEFNYDEKIRKNEDVSIITTVQGHLAWVVKELATKSSKDNIENLIEAFDLVKDKLSKDNQNLYIVLEWLIPLVEISNRRLWLANKNPQKYKEFKKLLLDPENGLVERYSQYAEISRNLVNVFYYVKDLTTDETIFILKKLLSAPESDALLVYFALFRERHYQKGQEAGDILGGINPEIFNYDPSKVQELLKVSITDSKNNFLREQLAWQFWKILKDVPEEFCNLVPWINLLFQVSYNKTLFSNLEMILEDWYERDTSCENPSHRWLVDSIQKAADYVNSTSDERVDMWLSVDNLLNKVAEQHPKDLTRIVKNLYKIWMKGGYIGDPGVVFNSYKFIKETKIRSEVLNIYKDLYSKMKAVHSKLREVNFE